MVLTELLTAQSRTESFISEEHGERQFYVTTQVHSK